MLLSQFDKVCPQPYSFREDRHLQFIRKEPSMRIVMQLCASTVVLLAVGLAGGCGSESREAKKPSLAKHETGATTKPAAHDTVAATKPAAHATDPAAKKRFWFTYAFNPPGKRD